MRDFAIARADLERANPAILGNVDREVRRREDVLAFGRNFDERQRDDVIGFAELPAVGECRHRWLLGRIAARRTGVHPFHDRVDLLVGEPGVVGKRAVRGVREPRRHQSRGHFLFDRSRPRTHLVIRAQCHRRDLAWPMTRNAVGVENRRHVFGERRRRASRRSPWRLGVDSESNDGHEHADEEQVPHSASTDGLQMGYRGDSTKALGYTECSPASVKTLRAGVAELADALASGASPGNRVEVRVLSSAPLIRPPASFMAR